MVTDTLDYSSSPRVADAEAFANSPPEESFTSGGSVEEHIPGDDLLGGHERGIGWWTDGDTASGQTLAYIVVGVTGQSQGDSLRQEGAEAVAR